MDMQAVTRLSLQGDQGEQGAQVSSTPPPALRPSMDRGSGSGAGSEDKTQALLSDSAGAAAMAAKSGVGGLATESKRTAEFAARGAFRGMLEATRALELITIGCNYKVSSTAFVTFKSRVAKISSQQMLLSHEHYNLKVIGAPNPKDVVWDNVSKPSSQIRARSSIANLACVLGAVFW
ncbi:hypothetical protein B484DRAFT_426124, partial [Ochromonadaceae sp. CCMP2298]